MALNSIKDIIEDFRQGKIVILMDDEDRENEGDIVYAAESVTGGHQLYGALWSWPDLPDPHTRALRNP